MSAPVHLNAPGEEYPVCWDESDDAVMDSLDAPDGGVWLTDRWEQVTCPACRNIIEDRR